MNPRKLQLLHLYSFASMTAPALICTHGGVALWPMQEPPVIVALNQNLADAIGLSRSCLVSSLHIQLEAAWADHRLGTHIRIDAPPTSASSPRLHSILLANAMPLEEAGHLPHALLAAPAVRLRAVREDDGREGLLQPEGRGRGLRHLGARNTSRFSTGRASLA